MAILLYTYMALMCSYMVVYANEQLIILDDSNFEHLTQAATGATTGDWFILMRQKGDCSECDRIESVLKDVAEQTQGRLNVAKVDPDNSRLTLRRFKINKKPTLMFFRLGYQWQYSRFLGAKDIVSFVTEGFMRENARPVYKELDRFDVWYEDYVKEMKASYKHKRLPELNALFVTLVGVFVGFILLLCMLPKKTKVETEEKEKKTKQSKKKR